MHTLEGHKAPVRGLLWNPELPYLLISGSWDYAIRIWDTRYSITVNSCKSTKFNNLSKYLNYFNKFFIHEASIRFSV